MSAKDFDRPEARRRARSYTQALRFFIRV